MLKFTFQTWKPHVHSTIFFCQAGLFSLSGVGGRADGTVNFAKEIEPDILEIGYVLHPDLWGQGLMPEAVSALVDFGFTELELHKIEIAVYDHNPQSRRVAEKLGFSLETRLRKRKKIDGDYQDKLIFGLLREEWEEQHETI